MKWNIWFQSNYSQTIRTKVKNENEIHSVSLSVLPLCVWDLGEKRKKQQNNVACRERPKGNNIRYAHMLRLRAVFKKENNIRWRCCYQFLFWFVCCFFLSFALCSVSISIFVVMKPNLLANICRWIYLRYVFFYTLVPSRTYNIWHLVHFRRHR